MNHSSLIDRIKLRIQDFVHATDYPITLPPLAPVAHAEVDELESKLGFEVPALLRKLYTEVANGHFGPDFGISGIHNLPSEIEKAKSIKLHKLNEAKEKQQNVKYYLPEIPNIFDFYQTLKSQFGVDWPVGLVPLLILDREGMDCIDCTTENGKIIFYVRDWHYENTNLSEVLLPVASSLEEYLEAWLLNGIPHDEVFRKSGLHEKSLLQ